MIDILGVKIDEYTYRELFEKLADFLKIGSEQGMVVTTNPEFIILAQKDEKFKNILNESLVSAPDGVGIVLASSILYGKKIQRITGGDAVTMLCRIAEQFHYSIFLFGAESKTAQLAKEKLEERFPFLRICGALGGVEIHDPENAPSVALRAIANTKPDILLVALGHGKQEKFIYHNLKSLPSVKLAMGVGGTLDYISGRVKRAPCILQKLGFEWLYRLIKQPRRLRRILNAVIVFPLLVLRKKYF